ncbi:hypothetical protein LTR56_020500 [Elasticomyces elasticus]|nr:hypothetical protein LTR56_020500 [Elasticomyces elasticus]KAK5766384.1 hypothetical protein LTS12_003301 [Elasticomyces elasticus]
MSMKSSPYRYQPLDPTKTNHWTFEIRLLTILPGPKGSELELQLRVVCLDDVRRQYHAVSYVWGEEGNSHETLVDGKILYLRDNIWRFLKHSRDASLHTEQYWVDAICINQRDADEKASQIGWMGSIYSHARSVLMWLGNYHRLFKGSQSFVEDLTVPATQTLEPSGKAALEEKAALQNIGERITRILQSPYWLRLWVFQEVRLASTANIISGTGLLPFQAIANITNNAHVERVEYLLKTPAAQTHRIRLVAAKSNHEPISYYVGACKDHKCSEVRDHVFALLGVVEGGQAFTVNYDMPLGVLLFRTFQHAVTYDDGSSRERVDALEHLQRVSSALPVSSGGMVAAVRPVYDVEDEDFMVDVNAGVDVHPSTYRSLGETNRPRASVSPVDTIACAPVATYDHQTFHIHSPGIVMYINDRSVNIGQRCRQPLCMDETHQPQTQLIRLQHWRPNLALLQQMRTWMTETPYYSSGEHRDALYYDYHFSMPCSFAGLAELHGAIKKLQGLPDSYKQ